MALLAPQTILATGLNPTFSAVSASDTIIPSSGLILHVKNAGGSTDNVVVGDGGVTPAGNSSTGRTIAVAATTGNQEIYIPPSAADPATGLITITHSFTTSVTCALKRVG